MTDDSVWISLKTTDNFDLLQRKVAEADKEINSLTVEIAAETDAQIIRKLKSKRNSLVKERRFMIQARRAEGIILNTSFDVPKLFKDAKEKAYAEGWPKNNC